MGNFWIFSFESGILRGDYSDQKAIIDGSIPPGNHSSDFSLSDRMPRSDFSIFRSSIAALLFTALIPVILFVYFSIMASGQSPIYSQVRIGRSERPFKIYKFRTIPAHNTPYKVSIIQRVGARWFRLLGEWLRRTGLDELPQLINILIGDMNFFGPRPLTASDYQKMPVERSLRSFARPGLSGLAQVLGGQALDPAEKLKLDLWYLQNRSLCVDLSIFCLSILRATGLYNTQYAACLGEDQLLLKATKLRRLAIVQLVRP